MEVKCTTDPDRVSEEYYSHRDTSASTSLICVDLNRLEIDITNKEEPMPGESKALNYLASRRANMRILSLADFPIIGSDLRHTASTEKTDNKINLKNGIPRQI